MNVYDFDGTIYQGESTFDFYLYSVKKQPCLIKYLFIVTKTLILYKLCRVSEEKLFYLAKRYAKQYLIEIKDLDAKIIDFWDKHQYKIKPFYLEQQKEDDVVISASISFILEEIFRRIGVKHALSTQVDKHTGEVLSLCFRKTKADLFRSMYPGAVIENFYTDSLNDSPMIALAKRTYLVKGNRVSLLHEQSE